MQGLKSILKQLGEEFPRPVLDLTDPNHHTLLRQWAATKIVIGKSDIEFTFLKSLQNDLADINNFYQGLNFVTSGGVRI